jgi:hypothetical protein
LKDSPSVLFLFELESDGGNAYYSGGKRTTTVEALLYAADLSLKVFTFETGAWLLLG